MGPSGPPGGGSADTVVSGAISATTTLYDDSSVTVRSTPGVLQIGTGTLTQTIAPLYRFYNNTISEELYLASELNNQGGTITAIRFYQATSLVYTMPSFEIRMMDTAITVLPAGSFPGNAGTIVFSGALPNTLSAPGWYEIVLQTPFVHSASQNLDVYIRDINTTYVTTNSYNYTVTGTSYMTNYAYSDTLNPPTTVYQTYNRPNIQIVSTTMIGAFPDVQFAPKNTSQWSYATNIITAPGNVTGDANSPTPGNGIYWPVGSLQTVNSRLNFRLEQTTGGTGAYFFDVFRHGSTVTSVGRKTPY
jgi:hypothetical protein